MFNIVIARYKEDAAWVNDLPDDCRVYLYNKGEDFEPGLFRRDVRVIKLPNVGRESGTYFYHLMHHYRYVPGEFTVFTQGDPFTHSPDFLNLMRVSHLWRSVQPLSQLWLAEKDIPPARILAEDKRDWIGNLAIRAERFSLTTWNPTEFLDRGAVITGLSYLRKHMLPEGFNIAAHCCELIGLSHLAEQAWKADFGVFSYGAIFAVNSERIRLFLDMAHKHLKKMELLSRAEPFYGYVYERLWLHFFGEPFIESQSFSHRLAADTRVKV